MKLYCFKYGETEITEAMAFQKGNPDKKIPVSLLYFLLETNGKKILVDAGCDTMPGFTLFKHQKPIEVLEENGFDIGEITDVVITHAHHDHIDGVRYFPNAKIHIHQKELENGKSYLAENKCVLPFEVEKCICPNVTIKAIGGHCEGSAIVEIATENTIYVLCGDECYTTENLTELKPTGCSVALTKSTEFVNEYSKPKYTPILFHDNTILENIGHKILFDNQKENQPWT